MKRLDVAEKDGEAYVQSANVSSIEELTEVNAEGVPNWPQFSNSNPVVMYFNQTPHTGPVPSLESLRVLDKYFEWRRTSEGETWVK